MTVVYSEDRTSPVVQAKLAELTLALAQARHILRSCEIDPQHSEAFRAHAKEARIQADKALDGTRHSFTKNGVQP